jgi:hypothetical protein
MSSLVTSASNWTNDDTIPKKRQSTMRKTIKLRPDAPGVGEVDYEGETENLKKLQPTTIEQHQESLEKRNIRVNELLNKMTTTEPATDNKMGNFSPISPPSLNVKKDMDGNDETKIYTPSIPSYLQAMNDRKNAGPYSANNTGSANLSNYQRSYEPPTQLTNKPYYANMGISQSTSSGSVDNKLLEKINYMIHLLEEQGHEKTNNITEEFILYTFLGVFIIFVVDSFSRSGKYIR